MDFVLLRSKVERLKKRHRSNGVVSVFYELFVRLYSRETARFLVGIFLKKAPKSDNVRFIVGCYNSGTTIIKDCVCAHPDISTTPVETPFLSSISSYQQTGWGRALYGNVAEVEADRREGKPFDKERYLKELAPWMNRPIFLDKSISNSVRVPALINAFPEARFVYVYRKPEGVIRGIKKRSRPEQDAGRIFENEPYSDAFLYRQWKYFNRCITDDHERYPDRILFCSYERFLASPVEELRKIYAFYGLTVPAITLDQAGLHIGDRTIEFHNQSARDIESGADFFEDIARYEADYEASKA